MTAVEFYDRTPIENAISSLTTRPDKIIYIGDEVNLKRFEPAFLRFLEERKVEIALEYRPIRKDDLAGILSVLEEIVQTEDDLVFDLTGGDDLVLVAMGMLFEKYRGKRPLQMQWFHVQNGRVTDCDNDGHIVFDGAPILTVEEQIALYGGAVRYVKEEEEEQTSEFVTVSWRFTPDLTADLDVMWTICRQDPTAWNKQTTTLGAIDRYNGGVGLSAWAELAEIERRMTARGDRFFYSDSQMRQFERLGWIENYRLQNGVVSFTYKNDSVKRCLSKAGTLLEVKVLLTARRLTASDGTPYYSDSLCGVCIDWDGSQNGETENEVDVVLMRGLVPVFISCKNGQADTEELYKLEAVTERFGGKYAKRVLIADKFGHGERSADSFRRRTKDMKIRLVEDVYEMDDAAWDEMMKSLIGG